MGTDCSKWSEPKTRVPEGLPPLEDVFNHRLAYNANEEVTTSQAQVSEKGHNIKM